MDVEAIPAPQVPSWPLGFSGAGLLPAPTTDQDDAMPTTSRTDANEWAARTVAGASRTEALAMLTALAVQAVRGDPTLLREVDSLPVIVRVRLGETS